MAVDWQNPSDPVVKAGLKKACTCGALPGQFCTGPSGKPLPGRLLHFVRVVIE
jgi:hypothetical protein